jgi:hypothetical protein
MITTLCICMCVFAIVAICKIHIMVSLMQIDVEIMRKKLDMNTSTLTEIADHIYHLREKAVDQVLAEELKKNTEDGY